MELQLTDRLSKFLSHIIIDNSDHFMIGKIYKHYIDTNPNYANDKSMVYYLLEKILSTVIIESIKEYDHFHYSCYNDWDNVKILYTRRILYKFFNTDDIRVFKEIESKYNFASW